MLYLFLCFLLSSCLALILGFCFVFLISLCLSYSKHTHYLFLSTFEQMYVFRIVFFIVYAVLVFIVSSMYSICFNIIPLHNISVVLNLISHLISFVFVALFAILLHLIIILLCSSSSPNILTYFFFLHLFFLFPSFPHIPQPLLTPPIFALLVSHELLSSSSPLFLSPLTAPSPRGLPSHHLPVITSPPPLTPGPLHNLPSPILLSV